MSKPNILTIEQMQEIVDAAKQLRGYRAQLAELEEKLATGQANWPVMLQLMQALTKAFAQFNGQVTEEKPPAAEKTAPAKKKAGTRAPSSSQEPNQPIPQARPSSMRYNVAGVTGTLAELCAHHKKDYTLAFHQVTRLKWSIEQALGLAPPPAEKKVNSAPLADARPNPE